MREALSQYFRQIDPTLTVTPLASVQAITTVDPDAKPDAVLIDWQLCGMEGLLGLQVLRDRLGGIPVILLANSDVRLSEVRTALDQGVAGVVTRDMQAMAVIRAVRLILAGEVFIPSSVIRQSGAGAAQVEPDDNFGLTLRERTILGLLCAGMSNRGIGEKLALAEVTIKVQLTKVFRKLDAKNRSDAVRIAFSNGFQKSAAAAPKAVRRDDGQEYSPLQ